MKIVKFIENTTFYDELSIINLKCSQFLNDSAGLPLLKNLPKGCEDFQKVKVRLKRDTDQFTTTFNHAFESEHPMLRQRAIFTNGISSFEPADDGVLEPFYVFPIDNYNFLYCSEIENSSSNHKQTFDVILENFGPEKGEEIIQDVLRFSYTSKNLKGGIASGAEIIMYGIPFYFAIRSHLVENYNKLLSLIIN